MRRGKTYFTCQQCGYKSPTYFGKCPECSAWNSLVETKEEAGRAPSWMGVNRRERKSPVAQQLSEVKTTQVARMRTGKTELDRVLGGGVVPGSLILLAGDPGIGKSTLTLQMLSSIGGLYVSGEESAEQVKLRSDRMKINTSSITIVSESNIENILQSFDKLKTDRKLIIIDSIQTMWSEELAGSAGSVGQVRECTLKLLDIAKQQHAAVVLVGHVTKEGTIAGPKVLEHIVDTVLYLEGDRYQSLRLLRAYKNRFGPVDEVGVFAMEENGMQEVKNPSELFLGANAGGNSGESGRAICVALEGTRPLLVEIQALTVASRMPIARRVANGVSGNRLQMLAAIIQKHMRVPLDTVDIFINAASGIRVEEPAADVSICLAILSSYKNKPIGAKTVAIGEVGLLGEIRHVVGLERRIKEAKRLGFQDSISPKTDTHITSVVKKLLS